MLIRSSESYIDDFAILFMYCSDSLFSILTIPGLHQKTNYGRPNWDAVFETVAEDHPETSVGVFFCGPKVLSTTLHQACNKHSKSEVSGTHFFYNKENF